MTDEGLDQGQRTEETEMETEMGGLTLTLTYPCTCFRRIRLGSCVVGLRGRRADGGRGGLGFRRKSRRGW